MDFLLNWLRRVYLPVLEYKAVCTRFPGAIGSQLEDGLNKANSYILRIQELFDPYGGIAVL